MRTGHTSEYASLYASNGRNRNDDLQARARSHAALAEPREALSWVTDDSIDRRVTDTVHRWLQGMEEAIARAASRSRK